MTVEALRKMGHMVMDIRGTTDEGMPDGSVWEIVQREKMLLITTDKGFAQHRNEQHHGILIVRLRQPNRLKIHQRVIRVIAHFSEKEWPGLVIMMRDKIQSVWRAANRK